MRKQPCICEFDHECSGDGVIKCIGCGGDFCVCGYCCGQGERKCVGCQYCGRGAFHEDYMEDSGDVFDSEDDLKHIL